MKAQNAWNEPRMCLLGDFVKNGHPQILHYKSRFLLKPRINLGVSAAKIRSRIGASPWDFKSWVKISTGSGILAVSAHEPIQRPLSEACVRFLDVMWTDACAAETWLKINNITQLTTIFCYLFKYANRFGHQLQQFFECWLYRLFCRLRLRCCSCALTLYIQK